MSQSPDTMAWGAILKVIKKKAIVIMEQILKYEAKWEKNHLFMSWRSVLNLIHILPNLLNKIQLIHLKGRFEIFETIHIWQETPRAAICLNLLFKNFTSSPAFQITEGEAFLLADQLLGSLSSKELGPWQEKWENKGSRGGWIHWSQWWERGTRISRARVYEG